MFDKELNINNHKPIDNDVEPQAEKDNSKNTFSNNQPIMSYSRFSWNDINSLRFTVQAFITIVVLFFCIYQLATGGKNNDGKNDAIYWGGITGLIALWMPSPSSSGTPPVNQTNVGNVDRPRINP